MNLGIVLKLNIGPKQCDQSSQFWNILRANFLTKIAQIFSGFFEKHKCLVNLTALFFIIFGKIGQLFILTHCHTAARFTHIYVFRIANHCEVCLQKGYLLSRKNCWFVKTFHTLKYLNNENLMSILTYCNQL